uniref:Rol-3 five-bladed beta-propeller domain-containing protein n=1 Tax=Panagrolaimus davidi TaxID=227884 RepID=A0A914PG08_9BILA
MTPGLFSNIPIFPSVVAYIPNENESDSLKMIDILGRNFEDGSFPLIPSNNPLDVISFDNATKAFYFADASDISIFRSMSPKTIRYRFLDFLTITHLSIIPSKAVIVFSSAYQIVQYRLTGTFDRM